MTSGDVAGRYCGDRSADGPARVIISCGTDCDYGRYRDVGEGKNLTMRLHQSRVQVMRSLYPKRDEDAQK